jgi:hypothetical protein
MRKLIALFAITSAMLVFVGCEIDEPSIEINADDDPVATQPAQPAGDNSFLWKPISEAYSGHAVALLPANIEATGVTCNGEAGAKHPRANGNRQHFRFSKTGAAYGSNVKIVATLAAGGSKTWTVPDGAARWRSP